MPSDKIRAHPFLAGGSPVDTTDTDLSLALTLSLWAYSQPGESKTDGVAMWDTQLLGPIDGGNSRASEGLHKAVQYFRVHGKQY
jgi:hypothetical protein